jgi:hypothetical protein
VLKNKLLKVWQQHLKFFWDKFCEKHPEAERRIDIFGVVVAYFFLAIIFNFVSQEVCILANSIFQALFVYLLICLAGAGENRRGEAFKRIQRATEYFAYTTIATILILTIYLIFGIGEFSYLLVMFVMLGMSEWLFFHLMGEKVWWGFELESTSVSGELQINEWRLLQNSLYCSLNWEEKKANVERARKVIQEIFEGYENSPYREHSFNVLLAKMCPPVLYLLEQNLEAIRSQKEVMLTSLIVDKMSSGATYKEAMEIVEAQLRRAQELQYSFERILKSIARVIIGMKGVFRRLNVRCHFAAEK